MQQVQPMQVGISGRDPEVQQWFRRHEGRVPFMYLDTKGHVTVGIGFMLPNALAARRFSWRFRAYRGTFASIEQIDAEFHRVSRMSWGPTHPWTEFRAKTTLEISDPDIDAALGRILEGVLAELRKDFPDFDNYSRAVQLALLDMGYNLGAPGVMRKFPNFVRAIRERRWLDAARESYRPDVRADSRDLRNQGVYDLLASAASTVTQQVPR